MFASRWKYLSNGGEKQAGRFRTIHARDSIKRDVVRASGWVDNRMERRARSNLSANVTDMSGVSRVDMHADCRKMIEQHPGVFERATMSG